jgi:hypothetical protein
MTYKLKDDVTAEMLNEVGFRDNELGKNNPVEVTEEKEFTAIRTSKNVAVTIDHITYNGMKTYEDTIDVYRYVGEENNHKQVSKIMDWKPYIQDLIERGWVIEE